MRKPRLISTILFLSFLTLISQTLLFAETQKSYISYFKGSVSIYRKKTIVYPKIKMPILPGDSIETGKESNCEITYENGTVSSLEPNSVIKIGEIKKKQGLFTTRIKALFGSIICKVQKLKKGETFEVRTPTAVATVRGTVFEATVGKTQESSFNLLSGQLYAKSLAQGAKTYLLKDKLKFAVGREGIPDIRKLSEKEVKALKGRASAYIKNFIEEKKKEIKEDIQKKVKKGCLGFI